MAEDDLLRALDNLAVVGQLPAEEEAATAREERWTANCESYANLVDYWRRGFIERDLLRGQFNSPRAFQIKPHVMEAVFENKVDEIEGVRNLADCSMSEYANCLRLLLAVEEVHQNVEMRKHDIQKQWLIPVSEDRNLIRFGFNVPHLANKSPSIVANDYVVVDNREGLQLAMQIVGTSEDYVELPTSAYKYYGDDLRLPAKISFISAGVPFRACQQAVRLLQSQRAMQSVVFEEVGPLSSAVKIDVAETSSAELDGRLQQLNERQREAVIEILAARCRPKPYVLFGPPGTGKTRTLVEAIVQVYKRTRAQSVEADDLKEDSENHEDEEDTDEDERSVAGERRASSTSSEGRASGTSRECVKILVCINSNNCTDELYKQIKRELPAAKMKRLFAGDFADDDDEFEIVVTTNIKSGSLMNKNCLFDYVFVDEAGHANVAESLIPACVLKTDGCLVLAGDPHQLGPVVMCEKAAELGLNTSLLERLFKFNIYQKDARTSEFDRDYITMLQDCYRCDARILSTCNKLFYDNKLRCVNETPRGLLRMLQLSGPLQLRHVAGEQTRIEGSDSMFNQDEVDVCVDLVKRLYCTGIEPSQIGVTSPYKLQANNIRAALRKDFAIATNLSDRFARYEFVPI